MSRYAAALVRAAAAAPGAPAAARFLDILADRLAIGAASVVAVLDPGCVVLGGEVGRAGGDVLAARVEERLARMSPLPAEVRASTLGGGAVLRGALLTAREAPRRSCSGRRQVAAGGSSRRRRTRRRARAVVTAAGPVHGRQEDWTMINRYGPIDVICAVRHLASCRLFPSDCCEPPHTPSPAWTPIGRGTLALYQKQRTPGSVKVRTGGYSPRPGRFQRPVDQVKFLDRRLKSGWEAVRGGRAFVRAAVSVLVRRDGSCPASLPVSAARSFCRHRQAPESVPE